jgi:hypothetical protein
MRVRLRELGATIGIGVDIVQVGVVLQIAFAGLVACRAVERMIDQVHLEDELPRLHNVGGMRQDLHAVHKRGGARLDQTSTLAEDLDGTDAARPPRS